MIFGCLCLSINYSFTQELNKAVLDSIIHQCKKTNTNALIIYQGDSLLYENKFENPDTLINAMSATKSVASIAIGILLDKGFIDSVNQPVYTIYPEWNQGKKKLITIKHLLQHTSGLQNVPNTGVEIYGAPDAVQLALCAGLEDIPGTQFSYNNKACNLLAGIVEETSQLKLDDFLDKYLFSEMGIKKFKWNTDSAGNPYGMAGLVIYPNDFAKIGQLILNKGKWNGKQLINQDWVEKMVAPSEEYNQYGFQWWLIYEDNHITLDEDFYAFLKSKTDESTFQLLKKLEGTYPGLADVSTKARKIYSVEELKAINKLMGGVSPSAWQEGSGKIIGYAAEGYLGQFLIILPEKELVIVRMITTENFKEIPNNKQLMNLPELAKEL